jgi:Glycosyl hydrolases family 43
MRPILLWIVTLLPLMSPVGALAQDNGDGMYTNPPLYADYPDPDIIRVGEDFYLVNSTIAYFPGIPILHRHACQDRTRREAHAVPSDGLWAERALIHRAWGRVTRSLSHDPSSYTGPPP